MAVIMSKKIVVPKRVSAVLVDIIVGTDNTSHTYAYVTINGTTYSDAASDIEVQPGDIITLYATTNDGTIKGKVYINGEQMAYTFVSGTEYEYTVPDDVTAITIKLNFIYDASSYIPYGTIELTTS